MRTISAAEISDAVRALCIGSNRILPDDMRRGLAAAQKDELWPTAAGVLDDIIENYRRAERLEMPVCQDTGMACVFVELGQEVHIDGSLEEAIQEGVRRGYLDGYLRKSVVSDPIERINTLDNTPAVITYDVVMGDRLTITVAPKGAGSENMGRLAMLKPSDGLAGVKRFVLDAVEAAGPNPCPPIVVGSESAEISTGLPCWPNGRFCGRSTGAIPTRYMPHSRRNCWTPSMLLGTDRRASEEEPLLWE